MEFVVGQVSYYGDFVTEHFQLIIIIQVIGLPKFFKLVFACVAVTTVSMLVFTNIKVRRV